MKSALFVLVLAGVVAPVLHAHELGVDARIAGGQVLVEAYFDDGTPARNARVVVQSPASVVVEGRTDQVGRWGFPMPPAGQYTLIVSAGDGHRVETTLSIPDPGVVAQRLTEGQDRSEFTRPRWLGLIGGVVLIAIIAVLARWAQRRRQIA